MSRHALYGPGKRTVAAQWDGYVSAVLPADADDAQLVETRRAFYGGAIVALNLMLNGIALEALGAELVRFSDALQRDEA